MKFYEQQILRNKLIIVGLSILKILFAPSISKARNLLSGFQKAVIDATGLTSGVYYYQLLSVEFIEAKKRLV